MLVKVTVSIDDQVLCTNARHVKNSLYVCPWRPENYESGIHQIQIYVKVFRNQLHTYLTSYYYFLFCTNVLIIFVAKKFEFTPEAEINIILSSGQFFVLLNFI